MTGVEILSSNEVAIEYAFNWPIFWIFCGITVGIFVAIGIYYTVQGECSWGVIPTLASLGLILGAVFGCLAGGTSSVPVKYTTEYKVVLSDEVSMNEFYEHYEVVEQEGKIFTVREK